MKERYKRYLKIYLIPIFFIATSFIFTTFAWFAYTGLSRVSTEIDVKAWYIELKKDGQTVSNDIVITLDNVYPGMDPVDEKVSIQNKGDSDAKLTYEISSIRLMDTVIDSASYTSDELNDRLSHDYPFHVNVNLSKNYVLHNNDSSMFEVSVSWPLDSLNDALDSTWGNDAYTFIQGEKAHKASDPDYNMRPVVQIIISVTAEQYIEESTASDTKYNLGDTILYDVVANQKCNAVSSTCISTTVIDYDSKLSDTTVTLLPSLYNTFSEGTYGNYSTALTTATATWSANTRMLEASDLLKIISLDVVNSALTASNISPQIIGNLSYGTRMTTEIARAITLNGKYEFLNNKYPFLDHSGCFWTSTNYNELNGFALAKKDANKSEILGTTKSTTCKYIPVIIAPKANIN